SRRSDDAGSGSVVVGSADRSATGRAVAVEVGRSSSGSVAVERGVAERVTVGRGVVGRGFEVVRVGRAVRVVVVVVLGAVVELGARPDEGREAIPASARSSGRMRSAPATAGSRSAAVGSTSWSLVGSSGVAGSARAG